MSATAEHEFGMKVICLGGAKLLRKTLPAKGRAATHSVHSLERVSEGAARVCCGGVQLRLSDDNAHPSSFLSVLCLKVKPPAM